MHFYRGLNQLANAFILIASLLTPGLLFAQEVVSCGQTTVGSLTAIGEKKGYTFAAVTGDKITARAVTTSGAMTSYLELYDPTRKRLAYSSGGGSGQDARIDASLTADGTYSVAVSDYGNDATGSYNLTWQRLNSPCNATATSCGLATEGTLSAAGEQDYFTFTAAAGDKITAWVVVTSGAMTPYLEIYDSSGSRLAYGGDWFNNSVSRDASISATGPVTLIVSDYGNDAPGSYSVVWQSVNNPGNAAALTCGQSAAGSLSVVGKQDFYSFTAAAGDKATVRLVKTGGALQPQLELYDSTGTRLASSYNYSGNDVVFNQSLSAGGTYTLIVSDYGNDAVGSYNLTWQRLNSPCNATAASCGQTTSASLSATGEQDFYSFTAAAGDKATIRLLVNSGAMTPYLEVYDSSGIRIAANYSSYANYVNVDVALSLGGVYTVVVSDYGNDGAGSYSLFWQKLNDPCGATAVSCGQTSVWSIGIAGEQDSFIFATAAGDQITATAVALSGTMTPSLEIYAPSGSRVAGPSGSSSSSSTTASATISAGGKVVVIVSDVGNDGTGRYRLKLQKNSNSCPEVTVVSPNGGEILDAGTPVTVTWQASAPQGLSSQEIRLSTDGGQTFPTLVASSLPGDARSYPWNIPATVMTAKARLQVTVTDTSGATTPGESLDDFVILQYVPMHTTSYTYDQLGQLIKADHQGRGKASYTYDEAGNRLSLNIVPMYLPADFDSDGKSDIVWRNTASGDINVWFMNGATVTNDAWLPLVTDQQWQIVGIGDFNGDGGGDILWRYTPTGDMNLWFLNGTTVTSDAWLPRASDSQWQIAGIGDLNKDGKADIIWRNSASGDIDVWLMDGGTVTSDVWLPRVTDQQWQIAGIGDFNGDGGADIVWRYIPSGDIDVWLMDGFTVTSDAWLPRVADPQWQINAIGDFNGDGNAEIIWRHTVSGDINVWFMNGTTVTADAWLPRVTDLQWKIVGPK